MSYFCKNVNPINAMNKGDRIQLNDTDWQGSIKSILADGTIVVGLDNGIEMRTPENRITLIDGNRGCNTAESTQRDDKGRFITGHKKIGGQKKGTKSIRQTRKELLSQLQPYIETIGELIEDIDAPEDKILAITRMMKFCVPTYSSVEYSESTPRSLTAEEKLAQINARYNNEPEPTFIEDDEKE